MRRWLADMVLFARLARPLTQGKYFGAVNSVVSVSVLIFAFLSSECCCECFCRFTDLADSLFCCSVR